MIHYYGDAHLTQPAEQIVANPKLIHVSQFNARAARRFDEDLNEALRTGQPVVPILINSPGGSVNALQSMVDLIDEVKNEVKIATICVGRAYSAGAVLLTCGHEGFRFAAPSSSIMIHDAWSFGTMGRVHDQKAQAKQMQEVTKWIHDRLVQNTDPDGTRPRDYFENQLSARGHADWYLNAREARKHNIINTIGLPRFAIQVSVDFAFGIVKRGGK